MTTMAEQPTYASDNEEEYNINFVGLIFGRTVQWVRWCENKGYFRREDGTMILPRRTVPAHAVAGFRKYTLTDMAEMAEALHRQHRLVPKDDEANDRRYRIIMDKINAHAVTS